MNRITRSAVILLLTVPIVSLAAQNSKTVEDTMEEVTVIGDKSLVQLEKEFVSAEDRFFELFNELNDDWKYDVVCRDETPTTSHLKRRTCRTRHQMKLWEEAGKSRLPMQRGNIDAGAWASTGLFDQEMRDKIAEIAKENPDFLDALIEYRDRYQSYQSEKKRRCGKMLIVCSDDAD